MSKYIIDLRPDCKVVQQICVSDDNVGVGARSVELFDALTDDYVKENFKDLLEGEYQRGLEEGKKATFGLVADASNAEYQKGFEDGKAVNDKGCEGCKYAEMGSDTAICAECCNAYHNQWTASDDKIEVGDEVRLCRHKVPYIVTSCDGDDDAYILMTVNGGFIKAEKYNVRKTNRHFDIKGILEAMKHD